MNGGFIRSQILRVRPMHCKNGCQHFRISYVGGLYRKKVSWKHGGRNKNSRSCTVCSRISAPMNSTKFPLQPSYFVSWIFTNKYTIFRILLLSPQPFLGGSDSSNQIQGKIKFGKETLATLSGKWVRHHLLTQWNNFLLEIGYDSILLFDWYFVPCVKVMTN